MIPALVALVSGLILLVWSADRFVEGSAAAARHAGMPPILIGMLVVGFGTSAPEILVSVMAALQGNPGIALGNAYGSNITNIALILGVTALISPVAVQSRVLRKEMPILAAVTLLAVFQLMDRHISRPDAVVLLGVFAVLMGWTIRQGLRARGDALEAEMQQALPPLPMNRALTWLILGLLLLIASSRLLVWGAVRLAQGFGISDLIIGLTIVAAGTSLPELASSVMAARKKEHDIALGNILGSNLFNTLAVVGLAGATCPMGFGAEVLYRDGLLMTALTFSLFLIGYGFRGPGRINRWEGAALVTVYLAYVGWLAATSLGAA